MTRTAFWLGVAMAGVGACAASEAPREGAGDAAAAPVAGDSATSTFTSTPTATSTPASTAQASTPTPTPTDALAGAADLREDAGVTEGGGDAGRGAAVRRGLLVQYDFRETAGDEVLDTSGRGAPMPLRIHRLVERVAHGVRFRAPGGAVEPKWNMAAYDTPIISTVGVAKKVVDAVKASRELSVELWLKPAVVKQAGPARIVALAQSNYDGANLQITHGPAACSDGGPGQLFHIRVLDTGIGGNGCPSMKAPSQPNITGQLQHLVLTQDAKGALVLYVDGAASATEQRKPFAPQTAWSDRAVLALGNLPLATAPMPGASESNGRFWVGELYYVAVYDAALTSEEVKTNAAIPYQAR